MTHARFFQVPDSALSLRQAPPAAAGAPLRGPVHHRGGVLQEDNRQRAHHQAPLGHVQVQRYMNSRRLEVKDFEQLKVQRPTQQSTECQIISRCTPLVVHAEHKISRGCLMLDYLSLGSTESKTA